MSNKKEYVIEVTTTCTVYIEAYNDSDAINEAYVVALNTCGDSNDARIVDVIDLED